MKSTLDGLLGSISNRAPVTYASSRASGGLFGAYRARSVSRTEQLASMGAMGTVFAIVNKCSTGTASVEWKLYRKARSGKPEDRVEVTRHAALDLWNKPNKHMSRQEFVEVLQQHVDLTGESEWVVARAPGYSVPLELWPVRPDKMEPKKDAEKFLIGWTYTTPDGDQVDLGFDEVIQVRMPDPMDPYRGMGPVQTVLTDIGSSELAATWNRNFFANSAAPGGVIEVPNTLQDDEFNQMRDRWNDNHRGVGNAHKVSILEGGAKWIDRSYSQKDMQFTELRGLSREVVREAFGFPKPMLGSTDDVNRANAEAAEYLFAKWLLVPRLDRIKGALNGDLLPMFGATADDLEFDYCTPVPADEELELKGITAKSDALVALVEAGFDSADAAKYLGLPDLGYTRPSAERIGA